VADAMMDSTPIIVIAGQVATGVLGSDAFQEVDLVGLAQPITKWAYQIRSAKDVAWAVSRAFYIARSGRPGPVVLDFTKNAQTEKITYEPTKVDFIRSYVPFGKKKKDKLYQIIDQFTLFFFHFMRNKNTADEKDYWMKRMNTPAYYTWCGYAFEIVCLHHINQIVEGLGISGTIYSPCSWVYRPTDAVRSDAMADEDLKTGAQIDLLIDRNDKTITVCEMKYSDNLYTIDINYNERVQARLRTFRSVTKTKKSLAVAYVTPQGLTNNMYARRAIKQITAEQLFK